MAVVVRSGSVVVLASTFYTEALDQPFVQALAVHGENRSVVCVPYNQLHAFLLNPRSVIPEETPANVILLLRVEDLIRIELADNRSVDTDSRLRIFRERMAQFLDVLSRTSNISLTLLVCPSGKGAYDVAFLGNAVRIAEYRSQAELRLQQRHKVVLWSDFARAFPGTSFFNVAGDRLGHVPFSPEGLDALAQFFVHEIGNLPVTNLKARASNEDDAALQQFLVSLKVKLSISALGLDEEGVEEEEEVIGLLRHTTHFINTPDRKWEAGEITATIAEKHQGEAWVVRVKDRFGDYGISGAMTFTFTKTTLRAGLCFLSCPVLGKQVENALLSWIGHVAESRRLSTIEVPFVKGRDNQVLYSFLEQLQNSGTNQPVEVPPLGAHSTFHLPVAGLMDRALRIATNPVAAEEMFARMQIREIDARVRA